MNPARWKAAAAVAAALAMTMAGCGGDADDGAAGGKASVTVGVLPLVDYAPVYWAKDHGYFDDENLDVTFETLQGGPVGVQKVVTGEIQFAFSNPISSVIATSKGAPVQTVALVSGLGPGELGVFVKPDSPIKTMEDLDKKTVGINTTNNVGDVSFANLAKSRGLDVKPSWVEVPFPEIIDGVKNDSLEAGYLPEPFATGAKQAGLRQVADLVEGPNVGLPISTFVTSTQFAKSDPKTVKKFATALNGARADIAAHEDEFRTWLPKATSTSPEAASSINLPVFDVTLSVKGIQGIADLLADLNLIKDGYDAGDYTIVNEEGTS